MRSLLISCCVAALAGGEAVPAADPSRWLPADAAIDVQLNDLDRSRVWARQDQAARGAAATPRLDQTRG